MAVEDTLRQHYRTVEVDHSSRQRLTSVIAELSDPPHEPTARGKPAIGQVVAARQRLFLPGLTVIVVASCVAIAAVTGAILFSRTHPSRPVAGGHRTPGIGITTNSGPGLPHRTGFIGVSNAHGTVGLIRQSDSEDVEQRATATTSGDSTLDQARQHLTVVLSLHDPHTLRVIGEYNITGDTATVPIFCPHHDGVAFQVPAGNRTGHTTPVQAARNLRSDLSLAGFGRQNVSWTVRSQSATTATLVNTSTTLHATTTPNGSWVITRGQRCTT